MKRLILSAEEVDETLVEDEFDTGSQEFTSEKTSINSGKLPAIFHLADFSGSKLNLDYGGGKFDNATEYLAEQGVENVIYDPYNRTKEYNSEALNKVKENRGADTATLSNVLNVIKEKSVRTKILENLKRLLKPGGTLYITVYEGSGSGQGNPTKSGYQLNRKTSDYLEEIQEVFPDAMRKGKLIVCTNSDSIESSVDIEDDYDEYEDWEYSDELDYSNRDIPTKDLLEFGDAIAAELSKKSGKSIRCTDAYVVDYNRVVLDYLDWEDEDEILSQSIELDGSVKGYTADRLIYEYKDRAVDEMMDEVARSEDISSASKVTATFEEPIELQDISEKFELDLDDVVIIVDRNGEYEYEDKYMDFIPDTLEAFSMRGLSITDSEYILECMDTLLSPIVDGQNLDPGRYILKGRANLSFDFSNIKEYRDFYDWDDYESGGIVEDELEIDFDADNSSIEVEILPA